MNQTTRQFQMVEMKSIILRFSIREHGHLSLTLLQLYRHVLFKLKWMKRLDMDLPDLNKNMVYDSYSIKEL